MKVNFVRNEILLSEVSSEDIMFCNIAGRDTGSIYYNPKNPEHSLRIMFKDQAVIDSLNERGVPVKTTVNENNPQEVSGSLKLNVYPDKVINKITEQEETSPKIVVKDTTGENLRLTEEMFRLVDTAVYRKMTIDICIAFHSYISKKYNRPTTRLDEMKVTIMSFSDLYQASEGQSSANGYFPDEEEEAVPF